MFCFSPKFNTGTTAGFRLANLWWYGRANLQEWERNRAELSAAQRSPISIVYGLCQQGAGTLCCCGCLERPNHFVDGVIEDIPAAVVLLWALSHPTNTTLLGDTPAGIMRPLDRIPPASTAPFPGDSAHFASVSSSSFHGVG
jgi:hypothetical protein